MKTNVRWTRRLAQAIAWATGITMVVAMPWRLQADEEPNPTQGTMKVMGQDGDTKVAKEELPLKHTKVEAEISGFVSRVKVTQTFTNPYQEPIEAVYVFPLPQDAAVNDMQIRIADRVIKSDIKKREEARKIYEEARDAGKTAALLEQERPNIFSQSVANIMPGSDILVEITYDEVLKYEKGGYEFVFPMVVGPRFIPGTPTGQQGGGWAPDTDKVPDASRITPPVLKPGERNGHDIELSVKLNAGLAVRAVRSPSHQIELAPELPEVPVADGVVNGPCQVTLSPADAIPNKDFVLRYDVAGAKPEVGFLAHRGDLGGYFLLMFQPPEQADAADITPKEMVFVVDTSGSMSGEPIALVKQAMRHALKNLNPDDTFQIIRFSESASPFAKEPLPNTPENVRRGLSYINGLEGEGGTMMIEGIKAALDYPLADNRLRIVCFMTDGYIGNESEILDAIQRKIGRQTRLFSLGVGSSVNRYLLDRMADVGRGAVQYVVLNEKPDEAVNKFYERVRNPVLTDIRVDWAGLDVRDLIPARIPDLFTGQPIFALGRFEQAGSATVKVQGRVGGREVTYDVAVTLPAESAANAALAPLWARGRIKELSAEQYGGENPDVVKAITDLALKYRLMSPYTSFVAVEEKVVNEDGKPRTIQVPVEMPEGVSYEGVFGNDGQQYPGAPAQLSRFGGGVASRAVFCMAPEPVAKRVAPSTAPTAMPREEKEDFDVVAVETTPMPQFAIEWQTQLDGQAVIIELRPGGELWKKNADPAAAPQSVLLGRLRQADLRMLWVYLDLALKSQARTGIADPASTLKVRILDDQGQVKEDITVTLDPQSSAASAEWTAVLDFLKKSI